jgi:hypothetical protein
LTHAAFAASAAAATATTTTAAAAAAAAAAATATATANTATATAATTAAAADLCAVAQALQATSMPHLLQMLQRRLSQLNMTPHGNWIGTCRHSSVLSCFLVMCAASMSSKLANGCSFTTGFSTLC